MKLEHAIGAGEADSGRLYFAAIPERRIDVAHDRRLPHDLLDQAPRGVEAQVEDPAERVVGQTHTALTVDQQQSLAHPADDG
jgi:hypothetical protein